jgi:hypothetical protein
MHKPRKIVQKPRKIKLCEIVRPVAPPDVSPVKGILSSYSFLFLDTPGHYCMRKYRCWCKACSLVRGRGHGCVSHHKFLDVPGCSWVFALEAHCLEGRAVHRPTVSRYRAAEEAGGRVGWKGLVLGEARWVGLCAGSDTMVQCSHET